MCNKNLFLCPDCLKLGCDDCMTSDKEVCTRCEKKRRVGNGTKEESRPLFVYGIAWGCKETEVAETLHNRLQQEDAVLAGFNAEGLETIRLPLYIIPCWSLLFPEAEYVLPLAVPESTFTKWKAPNFVTYVRLSFTSHHRYKFMAPDCDTK